MEKAHDYIKDITFLFFKLTSNTNLEDTSIIIYILSFNQY